MSAGVVGWLCDDRPPSEALLSKKEELEKNRTENPTITAELAPKGPISPHEPDKWTAVNLVSKGDCTTISLWEWKANPQDTRHRGTYAILKAENDRIFLGHDQTGEGEIMDRLMKENRTDHLVKMIYRGTDYHKLYLEYCLNGNLQEDIVRRRRRWRHYSEEHLWRMFLCLVKGSRSLGGEHLRNNQGPATVLVHFDLSPENSKCRTGDTCK